MNPNKSPQIDSAIRVQARDWLVLLNSGAVSEQQREAFGRWMAVSEAHEQAFIEYEQTWQQLGQLAPGTRAELRNSVADLPAAGWRAQWNQWLQWSGRSWQAAALASVLLLGVWVVLDGREANPVISHYQTAVAQLQTITLPDGSQLTLAAKTRINAWQTEGERHVELLAGQAFFDIAKNPQQPFYVSAGGTRVRVVGTRFDVNKFNGQVRVSVEEGIVSVSALALDTDSATPAVVLTAGNTVTQLADGVLSAVGTIDPTAAALWRSGRLVYNNATLVEVISEVNRYYDGEIIVHDALKNERITMALTTAEVNQLPAVLAQILPIRVQHAADKRVYLFPAH